MVATSRLGKQQEVITGLGGIDARFALIGGLALAPHNTQDMEDIRALIAANRAELNIEEVREYFRLFNREELLQELLK